MSHRRMIGALLLTGVLLAGAACSLSTSPSGVTPAPTATMISPRAPLTVAWVVGGDLVTWRSSEGQARRIASGGVIRSVLSPDGAWIAYLRGPGGDPRTLWISDTPGANERQLLDVATLPGGDSTRRMSQVVWAADSSALYVTMRTGSGLDARPADDLWCVDVVSGAVERLLDDGDGGHITISPDGLRLALASAGEYSQPGEAARTPGRLALYAPDTRERSVMLEFQPVATASEARWLPQPRWLPDGSGLRVAIPPPELVYGDDDGLTALWWLPVSGEAQQVGQVEADFFGLPVFSADGAWTTYIQRRTSPQQTALTLMLAASDGSAAASYVEGEIGALGPAEWLPGAARFVFANGAPGAMWIGGPGGDAVHFPSEDVTIREVVWADANTYVYSALAGESFTLFFGLLDVPTAPQPIATLEAYPVFDAVLP